MTSRQDLPKLTLPPAFSKKCSLGWDVRQNEERLKMHEGFFKYSLHRQHGCVQEQDWESWVLGSGLGCFSHLLCDVFRSLHLSGLVSSCVKEWDQLLIQQTWTKDLPYTGTMLKVGDTETWDAVSISGELSGQGWEQLVKGAKRREGKLSSLVGETGGNRDEIWAVL